ncbi:hypothetical protein BIW11_08153, partial [Tropilaelaps mercedesae]
GEVILKLVSFIGSPILVPAVDMLRRYETDGDILSELKTHLVLGQWELVEAFVKFLIGEEDKRQVTEILTSVALQPHLNSYCLELNIRSPEHLAFLAARYLCDEKLAKDACLRCMLREIPQLNENMKYFLLEAYTQASALEQRVLNSLRQCCLMPRPPTSVFVVLEMLRLPQVTLECVLQVCVQIQQTNSDWPINQLMDKLQELISFTPVCDGVPDSLLRNLTERLVEVVVPRRIERLMSLAIGCRNVLFQRKLLQAISDKECILSRAKAEGNQHFLELHLDNIITSIVRNERLPDNLDGVNLRPLALMFVWEQLSAETVFSRLDELEKLYPKNPFILRLATIVRECRLISSVTKVSLLDLITQRQTQSLLRVVYSTGALRGMKDAQVLHIVNKDYQSHMLRGYLALKHVSTALHYAILIAERRVDRNSIFQPTTSETELHFDSAHDSAKYIEQHGPDVSFDALVNPELHAMESLLAELPNNELKVEVLEDIFSLLFVSHRELHQDEPPSDEEIQTNESSSRYEMGDGRHCIRGSGFLASKKFIRTLLPMLVSHIRASKLKLSDNKSLLARLGKLLDYVVNARWRLELVEEKLPLSIKCVENIDVEDLSNSFTRGSVGLHGTPPSYRKRRTARLRTKSYTAQTEPRAPQASVIELMLSTMDALLRHCLWKGDYERAQQVRKVATVDNSDVADGAELDFCLSTPRIEEELIRIQKSKLGSSELFSAADSFLQATPLSSNFGNLCRFYLNLAFTPNLNLSLAHKLLTYSADLSKDDTSNNGHQAINRAAGLLASVCEKLTSTDLSLEKVLNFSTCHLDGVRLREGLLFWAILQTTIDRVGELLDGEQVEGSSSIELHQEFFKLGKMLGSGLREYRTRLNPFNFDFTRALYAHARQVYKALEEKRQSLRLEERTNGGLHKAAKGGFYFRVLEECSPSMTLLKLILHDHVSPTKLEEFASKMKLNITQCVSKEILPNIYMRTGVASDFLAFRVLNVDGPRAGGQGGGSNNGSHRNSQAGLTQSGNGGQFSRSPSFVAKKLLSQLIDILRERCPSSKKLVMERYENLREVAFSTQFDRWRESTRELSNLDLTKLKSEERVAFFLNVLHCLELERLIQRCRKGLPLIQSTLERQIDESLYGYEIGCMGVVTILQLKYSVLFFGHSLPPLPTPLIATAAVDPQAFLPAQQLLTVYSLVQCHKDDPPLRVIETDGQLSEGFARAILKVNVDDEKKKLYVPWQMEEIVKGKYFVNDPKRDLLRITLLKIGGSGFTFEFVRSTEFYLNLQSTPGSSSLCERHRNTGLRLPPSVIRYMEQHCAPVGVILKQTMLQGEKIERSSLTESKGSSALERMLAILPDAKQTLLSGNVADDIWIVLESLMGQPDSLVKMLECIDFCDAICGSRLVTSKLLHLKQLILKVLIRKNYRYLLRMDNSSERANGFIENYVYWTDKDIENACQALKSVILKEDPHYGPLVKEMERALLYQSIGRLLHVEWRSVPEDIPWVISKLREGNRFDFIYKISILDLIDTSNVQLTQTVKELSACHHFALNREEDYFAGLRIVDNISNTEARLAFCRRLLDQLTPCRGKLYLLRYMISTHAKEQDFVNRLEAQALGLEALLAIPIAQRWEYLHLDEWPELIVETLLMNGHLELVGRILERAESLSAEFVAKVDGLCEVFAKKALELSNMTDKAQKRASVSAHIQRASMSSFIMPSKPPSVKEWVRDQDITKCMICQTKFAFLVRKHHCRRCGRVVCKNCSSKGMFSQTHYLTTDCLEFQSATDNAIILILGRLLVTGYGRVPARVCDDCFVQTVEPEVVEAIEAIEHFTPNTLSKKVTPVRVETTWRIKAPINEQNREYNIATRRIFCYERAPSVSLCLSILDRHSNPETAAEFILSLCDRLVPLLGSPSEIDHGLGIAMLQALLIKARFNLLKTNKQASLEWCDSYLQTLDLLKLLVKDNCQSLIPKELLQQKNSENKDWRNVHRKLRDKLLDAERFQLALEVSTKCNLQTNVVLATWGISMIKAGDWSLARDKLIYCLRRPLNMNNAKTESPLLKDILAVLQNSTYVGLTRAAAVFCPLANLKNIKANGIQYQASQGTDHLVTISTESWFYLENFACHSTIISYLTRKGQLNRALMYCFDNKCDNEVFIENLFMACLRTGSLEQLFLEMKLIENCLTRFNTYLLSLCIYLKRQNFVNALHRL